MHVLINAYSIFITFSKSCTLFVPACNQPEITGDLQCKHETYESSKAMYYFDPTANECLSLVYNGCSAGTNHFRSVAQCEDECRVPGKTINCIYIEYTLLNFAHFCKLVTHGRLTENSNFDLKVCLPDSRLLVACKICSWTERVF